MSDIFGTKETELCLFLTVKQRMKSERWLDAHNKSQFLFFLNGERDLGPVAFGWGLSNCLYTLWSAIVFVRKYSIRVFHSLFAPSSSHQTPSTMGIQLYTQHMDSIKTLGLESPISFKHLFHSRPKSRHFPVVKLERRLSLLVLKLQKFLGGKIIFLCFFSMAKKKKIVQV